jgi:hypothetical protein
MGAFISTFVYMPCFAVFSISDIARIRINSLGSYLLASVESRFSLKTLSPSKDLMPMPIYVLHYLRRQGIYISVTLTVQPYRHGYIRIVTERISISSL